MIGGMEELSFALAKEFSSQVDTTLITWGKSQKYLPYFLPVAFFKSLYFIASKKITHVHIGDALLAPLGLVLKKLFGVKTTATVAGLDITFNFPGYQWIVPRCVAQLDKVICISKATQDECTNRGIPKEKCHVIPCGVYPNKLHTNAQRGDLENIINKNITDKKILITVGRLVKRKGVYWFIENVLPRLDKQYLYLVIGDGPEKERIQQLIKNKQLEEQVMLLGKVSQQELKIVYHTADFFIMPNIKVGNNIEGFGIVAVEASSTGLPVIAARLEGISDAVIDGQTGILVESKNPDQFIHALHANFALNKSAVAEITKKNYSWEQIGRSYINTFCLPIFNHDI